MRRLFTALLVPVLLGGPGPGGLLDRCGIGATPEGVAILPDRLREVSGLVFTTGGRLLAHDDELGIVYEIDPASGLITRALRLAGGPRDDFEGIAELDGRIYLSSSHGRLYDLGRLPGTGAIPWRLVDTGLGDRCEFEGLGSDPDAGVLLLPCKTPHEPGHAQEVLIFRWRPAQGRLAEPDLIRVKLSEEHRFAPSSIDRDPVSGHYVLATVHHPRLLEITPAGGVVAIRPLRGRFHNQPEGLAITPDGRLFISDEGGKGRARLSLYRCQR